MCIIALENRSYKQVFGNTGSNGFPDVNTLAKTYGYASQMYGFSHPSLPNYIALACGSDEGVVDDAYDPGSKPLSVKCFVDQLADISVGWKAYCEDMPSVGFLGATAGSHGYARKHNPWVYFTTVRTTPAQLNRVVPYTQLATDLNAGNAPPFIWITPNLTDSGHDGTDKNCNDYIKGIVATLQASTWYTQNHGKIILWWDEGSDNQGIGDPSSNPKVPHGGNILCVVISEANKGKSSVQPYAGKVNHLGLLHALETLYSVGGHTLLYLQGAANTSNGDLTPMLG